MKVDLSSKIENFDGESVRELDSRLGRVILNQSANLVEELFGEEGRHKFSSRASEEIFGEEITIGNVIRNVLGGSREKDKSGEESLKKFYLGAKCSEDEVVELSFDERKIIRESVEESGYNRIVYGRVCEMLSEDDNEEKE